MKAYNTSIVSQAIRNVQLTDASTLQIYILYKKNRIFE